jgi:hypothetical protein
VITSRNSAALCLAFAALLGASGPVHTQILPRGSVSITNVGNAPISFQIRSGVSDWTAQNIASGRSVTFDCRCAAFEVKIPTDHESVTRALAIGQRYRIYWNAAEKRWDIAAFAR